MDMINQMFNEEQGYLGGLESTARSQAASSQGLIKSEGAELESQTGEERALREQELSGRKTEAGLDAQSAMTRVKQMLSDIVNRNNAYLSAIPGWSSSTAPALAEKFGRTAMSQAGGVQTELQKTVNSINLEAERVGQFYDNKLKEVQMGVQRALQGIEQQLQTQLGNIQGMKAESAKAKAQATMQAWQNYANNRAQLNMQAFNFQQTLAQWAMEKGQSLQQAQQFALQNTPQLNPSAFGVRPPDQPIASGLGQPTTLGGSGIAVKTSGADEEAQRNLAMGIMPSTVSA
jgi:hypothetical protein